MTEKEKEIMRKFSIFVGFPIFVGITIYALIQLMRGVDDSLTKFMAAFFGFISLVQSIIIGEYYRSKRDPAGVED